MKIKITQGFTRNLVVIGFLLGCTLLAIAYARQKTDPLSQMPGTEFDPQARNQQCRNPLVGNLFAKTELFFGLSKSNGSEVSNQEFQDFVNTQVSRRFPDGLTVFSGTGQFKDYSGTIVREKSQLLILLYPFNTESNRKIEEIRNSYKSQFQQQSVLRVDENSCVSF
jgi:hypothetical protein